MATRKLDDWINSYLAFTDNTEPPSIFREWCAVSVIAAALQRKCRLEWGVTSFYPNMYIVLTAPAGRARKGTSMTPAKKFLNRIGIPMAAEAVTREALIRTLKDSEAVVSNENGVIVHSSLTVFSPELTVFLGYNNLQLMSDLTDWFDCGEKWTYHTKNSGTDSVSGVFINLLGATTPDLIRSTLPLDAIGGGLTSRIIFVYEEKKGKTIPFPFLSEDDKVLENELYFDIECINMLSGNFKVTAEFLNLWGDWYTAQEDVNPFGPGPCPKPFLGYVERRPTQVLKLSMIMNAAHTDSMLLDRVDLERAIDLLKRTEVKMTNVFGGVGLSPQSQLTYEVIEIMRNHPEGVTPADVFRANIYNGSFREINEVLDLLVQSKVAYIDQTNNGPLYKLH